jgi:23S rRNA pseudouridine2605 synthase
MFPIVPIVCYQSFVREHSGKERRRRGRVALLSDGARAQPKSQGGGTRVAKLMARAGLCSRREAEAWIAAGRVAVNGEVLTGAAVTIKLGDLITVDGKPLSPRTRTRLFLFHKPRGLVTTARDPQGRPTIFDYLREHWPQGPRVVSAGRLDINSEGLLLLTNDGGLARVLELPATGWVRRYRVRAKGQTSQAILDRLRHGATVEGMTYSAIEATLDRVQGANCWLTMALREGKNREIKRVLGSIGLAVNRLIRISFGPFQLGDLAQGMVEEVPTRVLRDQLGASLAKAAGVDFSSPQYSTGEPAEAGTVLPPHVPVKRARAGRVAPRPSANDLPKEVRAKPAPRRRKHISALRAKQSGRPSSRKRIARCETADRGGRLIPVERLIGAPNGDQPQAKPRAKKPAISGPGSKPGAKKANHEKAPRQRSEKTASGKKPRPRGGHRRPSRARRKP